MKSAKRITKKRVAKAYETENSFSIHDFPAPAILYSKKSAVIIEWNNAASKLLGYKQEERPYLKAIRAKGMRAKRNISKSKTGISMGIIPHTTKSGEEKLIEVINKQITIKGKECCLEWLVDQTTLVQSQLSNLHFYGAVTRASIVSRADLDGNITYVNSNFVKISGFSQKELLGKNHRIINSGHHTGLFWLNMWKTITSGKTWRGDVKNKAKDGSYYWMDTFIMPFTDENGNVKEFLSIRNDVTARKESEEALAQSHSRLSETLIFGKMGSAEINLTTLKITVSKELFQLLDLFDPEQVTLSLESFFKTYAHAETLPGIIHKIRQGIDGLSDYRRVVDMEFDMVTATGRNINVESQIIFKNKRALCIFHDITEKSKINNELVSKSKIIDRMLESITDGFFATDRELNFTLVSPVFAQLAKLSPEEIQGKNMVELFPYVENTELLAAYQEAIHTQRASTLEYFALAPSRQVYQVSIYPSVDGLFIYYKDVSLAKMAEAELRDTSELFRRLSDNVPGMIYNFYFTSEDAGNFPFVSSGAESLFGVPASELMNDSSLAFRMVHPEDFPLLMQTLKDAYHSHQRWIAEFRIIMPDNTVKWIAGESNSYVEKNDKRFWYGFLHDVTRQKKNQIELLKVYDELNAILNTSTDATFFLDDQYHVRVVNKTGQDEIQKLKGKQIKKGDSLLDHLPNEIYESFKENFGKALNGEPVTVEQEAIINKVPMWVHLSYLPVRNNRDEVIGVSVNSTNVTSRKLAEQELFKSRKYFELLVNSQSSYLIRTDMDGRYTFVNAKFLDRFGVKGVDMIGTYSLDTILKDDHELCEQTVYDCFAHPGKVISVTLRKPKRDGGYYWTEWEFVALQDENGLLMGIQAVGLDATERVIAVKEMQENEERFRTLINDISIGILVQGPRTEVHLTNQAALDLLGLSEDQLLGRTSYSPGWNIIHEDGSEFINADLPVPQAIETKLPIRGVVMGVYRAKKNDRAWLLVDAIPRLDEQGNIKNVICTFNNITDLKAAESSLQFTRFTINHTSDAVFWIRPDASVADMNPAAYTSLGYSEEEMLKMSLADIDLKYSDHSWHQFWKMLKEKKTITSISKQRRKDGSEMDVEINSNFIVFRDKEFNCSFVRDITERKKSELALIDSNQEKDMLIKEIHHRVKNNLQLISSILFIKMSQMKQSEMKDFLEDTRQKIRSIALIHERLLQTNSVNQVDISDYLGKLISDLEMSNTRAELRIYIEHTIEPEEMNLDSAIYCGLIINELVINSIKHAFVDRTYGNIKITLNKLGDMHQLIVSDDGTSMPENVVLGQTGSFGMQMLEIFVKQLKAKVEINRVKGTSFKVLF